MSSTSLDVQVVSIKTDQGVRRIYKKQGATDFLVTGLYHNTTTLPHPRGAAPQSGGAGTNPAPTTTEFRVTMREEDYPRREEEEEERVDFEEEEESVAFEEEEERMAFPPAHEDWVAEREREFRRRNDLKGRRVTFEDDLEGRRQRTELQNSDMEPEEDQSRRSRKRRKRARRT